MDNSLKDSTITITGGTGSFGSTMVKNLLSDDVAEIRVFSRDENKQDLMRNRIKDERVKFYIGDVRDLKSVSACVKGSDYVFHAAALKQVPSCEFFPNEAVATNVSGSENVLDAAVEHAVKSVVCLSTDKAVYPINVMGMTKALMEKMAQSTARRHAESSTRISVTRYGNVMMSRGSVIPLFIEQIKKGLPISITNPEMTRFMMSLEESVDLVKFAFLNSTGGDLFVKKAAACTVKDLAEAVSILVGGNSKAQTNLIGSRHGEKLFETLLSTEERARAIDLGEYFQVPLDSRSLDYQVYFEKGERVPTDLEAYTSHNTYQLNVEEVVKTIGNLSEYKELMDPK
jgi:UDP-glucose 4-epimerase